VGLERGPLSLLSTIEELLERKRSCSSLEIREYGRRDSSHWPRGTLYPQKLVLTPLTRDGRSVGIIHSRTRATEFSLVSFRSEKQWVPTRHRSTSTGLHGVLMVTSVGIWTLKSSPISRSHAHHFPFYHLWTFLLLDAKLEHVSTLFHS
jgi:hypothetical protein